MQLSLLELFSLLHPCFFLRFHTYQHCAFLLGLFQLVYLHCSMWPHCANAALAPYPRLQTFYPFFRPLCIFSLCTLTTVSCSWLFLFTSCFLFPSLTPSEFFNGMLGVSDPGALNSYTLFHPIPLTLFVSRILTLIYLLFPDLCSTIRWHPLPIWHFFLLMSQTLAAASSFLSGRAYPSLCFLPPLFLRLTPTLIM